MSDERTCASCSDSSCSANQRMPGEKQRDFEERQQLAARMCQITNKWIVLSGKGGVGKSTVAVNLAASLASSGGRVGLLDVDIHGPSVPHMLSIAGGPVAAENDEIYPVVMDGGLRVMSIGFFLDRTDAVIWRGPRKYGAIKQFLKDVAWGELDHLIVDAPPGTGDEPLAVAQLIQRPAGAIIVTTPQELAVQDVRRSVMFCHQINLEVLGVIENMSGFDCPDCGRHYDLFGSGGGSSMAREMGVPFLGAIPIELAVTESGEEGRPIVLSRPDSATARAVESILGSLTLSPDHTVSASEGTG